MQRREFLEASSVLAGGAMLKAFPPMQPASPMIGIQIGAVSFVDEGTDRVLDGLREMASINTLFAATSPMAAVSPAGNCRINRCPITASRNTTRRRSVAATMPRRIRSIYRNTSIKPERAPDHAGYDVLADVLPRAHSRSIKVIAWFEDVFAADVPGFEQAREVMVDGQRSTFACTRNPNTRNSQYSDFLKVVMYGLCGGERLAQYVRNSNRTLFADLTPDATLALTYDLQQYHDRPLNELAVAGLGFDYVKRETARAVAGASPNVKIWPGIDVDIPTAATSKKTQPSDVYDGVKAAFAGGAHGVILSRKYLEMRLDNIRGAGRAIRELRLA